ncbi:hypothetical protein ACFFR3_27780 [Nonomuraea salmonea]|jgi:hypothetical protein|uniref:ABC transporter permease n=1 Tax=Nonomuraea salmonea TaxID=46181 RepID=A0ABV5NSZ5_9ACTN
MIETPVLKAEWTKFSSVRATMVLAVAAVAMSAFLGWMFGNAGVTDYVTSTPQEQLDFSPVESGMRGVFLVQLLIAGIGVLVVSSEYGSGTMAASMAAVGRRSRLLAAKAGMTVLTALPVSVASVVLMFTVGQSTLASNGVPAAMPGEPAAMRFLLIGPVVLTLIALFGLALGFLLRGTAAAVNIAVAFLLLPALSDVMPAAVGGFVESFWPNAAPFKAIYGSSVLPDPVAYGIVVTFVAVMVAVAFARFRNRDA